MSEVVIFRSMNAHQVLIFIVVDTRIVCCVADSLQERSYASIGTTDYKNTKASIFCSEIIGFAVDHGRCGEGTSWERRSGIVTFGCSFGSRIIDRLCSQRSVSFNFLTFFSLH